MRNSQACGASEDPEPQRRGKAYVSEDSIDLALRP